jgi:class 3 adenylate cyclase
MKRGFLLLMLLLLVVPCVSASMTIDTVFEESYVLGEEISLNGVYVPANDFLGELKISFECGESEKTFLIKSYFFENTKPVSFSETIFPSGALSGSCKLAVSSLKEGIVEEFVDSDMFNIFSEIKVGLILEKTSFNLNEEIRGVVSSIDDSSSSTKNLEVSFSNNKRDYVFSGSNVSVSWLINETLAAGEYSMSARVYDLYGNSGMASQTIIILQQASSLRVFSSADELLPGELLEVDFMILDQVGSEMEGAVLISLTEGGDILYSKEHISPGKLSYVLPAGLAAGDVLIQVQSGMLGADTIVKVKEVKMIEVSLEDNVLFFNNTGNVPYQKAVSIEMGGAESFTFSKFLSLEMAKRDTFDLDKAEVPDGIYSVKVLDKVFEVEINSHFWMTFSWTTVVIIVLILLLVWFFFFNKRDKKRFNKLFGTLSEKFDVHKEIAVEQAKKHKHTSEKLKHFKKEKERVKRLFGKYVDPAVVDDVVSTGKIMKGEKKEVTAMFIDVRGFTKLSETHDAWQMRRVLNRYFDRFSKIIQRHGGSVNKYIGDALFVLFNAPKTLEGHKKAAVLAALEIQKEMVFLNEKLKSANVPQFKVGIGINSGDVVVGGFGAGRRLEYTAIGDAVNVASRLESNSKGGQILITEKFYNSVSLWVNVDYLGPFKFKNKANSIKVYQVLGKK